MSYAIARVNKIKSTKVKSAEAHNRREMEVVNSSMDPSKFRTILGKGRTYSELIRKRMTETDAKPRRKDAVVIVEIVLSVSADYFRPNMPKNYGKFNTKRLKPWVLLTKNFLEKRYKENLISLELHLDEATPHLHAIVTPIVKKRIKLRRTKNQISINMKSKEEIRSVFCAKEMFNLKNLYSLQDDYADMLKVLGIKRGRKNSKTKHKDISKYYSEVKEYKKAMQRLNASIIELQHMTSLHENELCKFEDYKSELKDSYEFKNQELKSYEKKIRVREKEVYLKECKIKNDFHLTDSNTY